MKYFDGITLEQEIRDGKLMSTSVKKFRKVLFLLVTAFLLVALSSSVVIEGLYFRSRGEFMKPGLSLEVTRGRASYGIPGQEFVYSANLINISIFSKEIDGCDFRSDVGTAETDYPYAVQLFDESTKSWKTIREITDDSFCRAMPTYGGGNHMVKKKIFPGGTASIVKTFALGAIDEIKKGDVIRLVAFENIGANAWETAVFSNAFTIEDDVKQAADVQYRISE